jgi:hypothetical protein
MKWLNSLVLVAIVLASLSAGAKHMTATKMPINQLLDSWVSNTEKHVTSAADAMPEEKYNFLPTAGEFTGVRTFAQQKKHLAANNYRMAAYILNQQTAPDQESEAGPDSVQSKVEIMDYLEGSFAALHKAAATVTESNLGEPIPALKNRQALVRTRIQLVVDAIAHSFNHYGQMVEYLRMNGIIPPDSRKWRFGSTENPPPHTPDVLGWRSVSEAMAPAARDRPR